MSTFNFPHIRKRSCRPYPESGAGTVEYVIVIRIDMPAIRMTMRYSCGA